MNNKKDAEYHWLDVLQQEGLRITAPRRHIVNILANHQVAKSPQAIFEDLKTTYPGIGLATIYRTLECLEGHGLIQRVHHPAGCHMFLKKQEEHAHFLICLKCNKVETVKGDDLTLLVSLITRQTGYVVYEHWLQFFGVCPGCREKEEEIEI